MKITLPGELVTGIRFASFFPEKAADMQPKSFTDAATKKTETKTAPDGSGRVQLRTSLKGLRVDDSGAVVGEEREVSLSLLEASDVVPGVHYGLSGMVWITHYQNDAKRMCLSIVAERIKPFDQINKVNVADLAGKLAGAPVKPQHNN